MNEMGVRMQRTRLRRTQPEASEDEIEAEVCAWLRRRPAAEHGDFPGPPSHLFG
jgi:hypothetical protein